MGSKGFELFKAILESALIYKRVRL